MKEEVIVGKQASERTEKVRETARRTDVEVEKTGQQYGQRLEPSLDDADFERHSAQPMEPEGSGSTLTGRHTTTPRSVL